jgi:DNA-binding NtrC family response regulator
LQEEVRAGSFSEDLFYRLLGLTNSPTFLCARGSGYSYVSQNILCDQFAKENSLKKITITA